MFQYNNDLCWSFVLLITHVFWGGNWKKKQGLAPLWNQPYFFVKNVLR